MFPDFFRDDVFRIETQRLWLRWPAAADAAQIEKFAGEAQVAQWTAHIPHPYPPGAAERFVVAARQANLDGGALNMALALRTRPQSLIGMISLEAHEATAIVGYWLGQPYWGAGLMAEAVRELTWLVWLTTDIDRVIADIMIGNARSRDVLLACGFASTGDSACTAPARGGQIAAERFELLRPQREAGLPFSARDRTLQPT